MELKNLLTRSRATDAFKCDVAQYVRGGTATRIELERAAPIVKIERLLLHLLDALPDLTIERISVRARSGCSDFTGVVRIETADAAVHSFEFTWCCRWRAEQEGYKDYFGFPDQIRAASEFDWRCFKDWRQVA